MWLFAGSFTRSTLCLNRVSMLKRMHIPYTHTRPKQSSQSYTCNRSMGIDGNCWITSGKWRKTNLVRVAGDLDPQNMFVKILNLYLKTDLYPSHHKTKPPPPSLSYYYSQCCQAFSTYSDHLPPCLSTSPTYYFISWGTDSYWAEHMDGAQPTVKLLGEGINNSCAGNVDGWTMEVNIHQRTPECPDAAVTRRLLNHAAELEKCIRTRSIGAAEEAEEQETHKDLA